MVSKAGSCDGPFPWSPSHEWESLLCISKMGLAARVFSPPVARPFEAQPSPTPSLRSRHRSPLQRSCSLKTPLAPALVRHISWSSNPLPALWASARWNSSAALDKPAPPAPRPTSPSHFHLATPPWQLSAQPVSPHPAQAATHIHKTALCLYFQTQNLPDRLFHWQLSEGPSSSTLRNHLAQAPQASSTARAGYCRHRKHARLLASTRATSLPWRGLLPKEYRPCSRLPKARALPRDVLRLEHPALPRAFR